MDHTQVGCALQSRAPLLQASPLVTEHNHDTVPSTPTSSCTFASAPYCNNTATTSRCARCDATINGVLPRYTWRTQTRLVKASSEQVYVSMGAIHATALSRHYNALRRTLSGKSTCAPCFSSNSAVNARPYCAANRSAVHPSCQQTRPSIERSDTRSDRGFKGTYIALRIHLRPMIEQCLDDLQPTLLGGIHQRSETILQTLINHGHDRSSRQ